MARSGKLTKSQFGFSMPLTAPVVSAPPVDLRKMEMIIIGYRTDEEEVLKILPEGLELAEPATASMIIAKYHFSTWGPYNEAILAVGCTWQGTPMAYMPYLLVTSEVPSSQAARSGVAARSWRTSSWARARSTDGDHRAADRQPDRHGGDAPMRREATDVTACAA